MRKDGIFVGVVAWMATVATVVGLVWIAVESAGRSVTQSLVSGDSLAGGTMAPPQIQTPIPTFKITRTPIESATSATATATTASPTQSPTKGKPGKHNGSPTSNPHRTQSPTPSVHTGVRLMGTQAGEFGVVTILCTLTQVKLQALQPASGWKVTATPVVSHGVRLTATLVTDAGQTAIVDGSCPQGIPTFKVEIHPAPAR